MKHYAINTGRGVAQVRTIVLAALAWVCTSLVLCAGPIVETPETWTSAGSQGWINTAPDVTLANPGGASGFLLITFPDQNIPPGSTHDTIYTFSSPATNKFTGNFVDAGVTSARFRFLASNAPPAGVSLTFGSGARVWSSPLTPPVVGQWTSYDVPFQYSLWSTGGTTEEFLADLQAVDWIGLHIDRGGTPEQYYGLDDFTLSVPEPADVSLFAAGLCGLILVFRKRVKTWRCSAGSPV